MGAVTARRWTALENFLRHGYDLRAELRFPFGAKYGWGVKYSHRATHLCYAFPERGAFTVTIQIGKTEIAGLNLVLPSLLPKTRELWQRRYPCGGGGWIHYRVMNARELADVKKLIELKKKPAER